MGVPILASSIRAGQPRTRIHTQNPTKSSNRPLLQILLNAPLQSVFSGLRELALDVVVSGEDSSNIIRQSLGGLHISHITCPLHGFTDLKPILTAIAAEINTHNSGNLSFCLTQNCSRYDDGLTAGRQGAIVAAPYVAPHLWEPKNPGRDVSAFWEAAGRIPELKDKWTHAIGHRSRTSD